MSFEDTVKQLEDILELLEKEDLTEEQTKKYLDKADELKQQCADLLTAEKNEIMKIAKENNISMDELDL